MNFIISASTDRGIAKDTNQDSFYAKTVNTPQGRMVFAVLCDGMGGLSKGELASGTVVHAFHDWSVERLPLLCLQEITDACIREEWCELVTTCNEKIKAYGQENGISLGTTLTAILLTQNRFFCINVGDTRAYEITGGMRTITNDHTVVAQEIERGIITKEEARTNPRRSVLLQCIGASEIVYPDLFFGNTIQNAVYMLCSDGFRNEIDETEIYTYLRPDVMLNDRDMKNNIDVLIALNKQRQERDNITCITVRTF